MNQLQEACHYSLLHTEWLSSTAVDSLLVRLVVNVRKETVHGHVQHSTITSQFETEFYPFLALCDISLCKEAGITSVRRGTEASTGGG